MTDRKIKSAGGAKRQLLLIVAIAVMTTVVPYIMYITGWGVPEATTNEGVLLEEPEPLAGFSFRDAGGEDWDLAEQTPRFRLAIPVRGPCEAQCRETLYLTRQTHIRLSGDGDQLERLYVQLGERDDRDFVTFLNDEHPRLQYLQGDGEEWRQVLGNEPALDRPFDGSEYYLLHRYGALAMAYNSDHTGNQLLDDLEFLIETSN